MSLLLLFSGSKTLFVAADGLLLAATSTDTGLLPHTESISAHANLQSSFIGQTPNTMVPLASIVRQGIHGSLDSTAFFTALIIATLDKQAETTLPMSTASNMAITGITANFNLLALPVSITNDNNLNVLSLVVALGPLSTAQVLGSATLTTLPTVLGLGYPTSGLLTNAISLLLNLRIKADHLLLTATGVPLVVSGPHDHGQLADLLGATGIGFLQDRMVALLATKAQGTILLQEIIQQLDTGVPSTINMVSSRLLPVDSGQSFGAVVARDHTTALDQLTIAISDFFVTHEKLTPYSLPLTTDTVSLNIGTGFMDHVSLVPVIAWRNQDANNLSDKGTIQGVEFTADVLALQPVLVSLITINEHDTLVLGTAPLFFIIGFGSRAIAHAQVLIGPSASLFVLTTVISTG